MDSSVVVSTLLRFSESVKHYGPMMNERYFHHLFSSQLQSQGFSLDITRRNMSLNLHPEWPTSKKSTALGFATYSKTNDKYYPSTSGGPGFIDFAIGNYNCPDVGIEFCVKHSWCAEEVIYDFVKLLDNRNPFKVGLSYTAVIRESEISTGGRLEAFTNAINQALLQAYGRLRSEYVSDRQILFIISELGTGSNRHWHFDKSSICFKLGLPA